MNSTLEALLRLLADGEIHSGEVIGRHLNVSRAAVWKNLQALSSYGIEVKSIKGKGYCLSNPLEFLEEKKIYDGLSQEAEQLLGQLDIVSVTGSTNNYLLSMISPGKARGHVCFAECQTDGRGRRGRHWISPLGNIALSLSWEFEQGAASLEGLSLAIGVGVTRALSIQGVKDIQLKWPNDIFSASSKLGGVLIEMTGDPSGHCQVVIGIGINLEKSPLRLSIDQPHTSLAEIVDSYSRNQLAADLLNQLLPIVSEFTQTGFKSYRSEWQALDAYRDQKVIVISGQQQQEGIARGVNTMGALLLDVDGELRAVHGGELSLRASL